MFKFRDPHGTISTCASVRCSIIIQNFFLSLNSTSYGRGSWSADYYEMFSLIYCFTRNAVFKRREARSLTRLTIRSISKTCSLTRLGNWHQFPFRLFLAAASRCATYQLRALVTQKEDFIIFLKKPVSVSAQTSAIKFKRVKQIAAFTSLWSMKIANIDFEKWKETSSRIRSRWHVAN